MLLSLLRVNKRVQEDTINISCVKHICTSATYSRTQVPNGKMITVWEAKDLPLELGWSFCVNHPRYNLFLW